MNLSHVECAWCNRPIYCTDQAYPSYFNVTGKVPENERYLQIAVPQKKRVLCLVVPRQGSPVKAAGADVVALSCSPECQRQIEAVWSTEELPDLVLN